MNFWTRLLHHSPVRYAIASAVGIAVALILLIQNGFDQAIHYFNAFSTAGAVVILVGLLALVSYFGAFNIFGYAFSMLKSQRRYDTLYDYNEAKDEKRRRENWAFGPYFAVGIVLLLLSVPFRFFY